ncbi:MAG: alpha/beta hydrolase [Candidatus Thioglobus autotrophicus]|nr:alpha/beta hydrolase [Candidatus Thioglobus autotrophicus]
MRDLGKHNLKVASTFYTKDGTAFKSYGDQPSPLIFIHGVGMRGDVWSPQVEYFSNDYQVITYDFLGHGESHLPPEEPVLDDYVEQLNSLLKHLNLSLISLVGHSMGALISVAFALKHPDKVKALVPINIAFNRSEEAQKGVLNRANQILQTNKILNIEQTLERWFKNKTSADDLKKIDKIRNWLANTSPQGYGRTYRLFALSDKVFLNKLSRLRPPVLYLTGDEDPNSTPDMSQQMAEETPNGSSNSLTGEAHMMSYIAANKVNPIIEQFFMEAKKEKPDE